MSTPTNTNAYPTALDKSRLTDEQKKKNHIVSEAKRREAIREQFDRLASLVPGMEGQGRSEAVVLQATVELMREQLDRKGELKGVAMGQGMSEEEFERCYSAGGEG